MRRHLILVGLPGAGKSTVGRRVAHLLLSEFTDIDDAVEAEAGRTIAAIFARTGEVAFRQLERAAMDRALAAPPHVVAAGAGWAAQPGNFAAAGLRRAFVVYLKITPELAAERLGSDDSRPLLAGGNRSERLRVLLDERVAWYRQAELEVDGAAEVSVVAELVVRGFARAEG